MEDSKRATVYFDASVHEAEKLREYNVSVTDVVNALRMQNATAPVGRVKGPLDEQSIRLVGRIESPAEFEQIVLKRRGNEVVRLAQVASVADGFAELASFSVRNGHPNVGISVTRSRDASTVTVAAKVRDMAKSGLALDLACTLIITLLTFFVIPFVLGVDLRTPVGR